MKGCTRCGQWHSDAEEAEGRMLSCTEVRKFWIKIKQRHKQQYGHPAQITRDNHGKWICFKCGRELGVKGKDGE